MQSVYGLDGQLSASQNGTVLHSFGLLVILERTGKTCPSTLVGTWVSYNSEWSASYSGRL